MGNLRPAVEGELVHSVVVEPGGAGELIVTPKAVKVKDSVESENPKHNLGYKRCKNISPNACSRTTPMHIPRHPLAATSVEAVAALISE